MRDSVGIVMPAYNAAGTVRAVLARVPAEKLAAAGFAIRVYAVDDGSTDGTGDLLRQMADNAAAPTEAPLTVLSHPCNRGYGAAQKTGLAASLADGNLAHVILHSDGQYAPEELPMLLAPIRAGTADVVVGSRFLWGSVLAQGMPLARMAGIRLFDALENLAFGLRGLEYHSGYMAYSGEALRRVRFDRLTDRFHFDGEMVLSAAKAGLRIILVPISTSYAPGSSSLHPLPYVREVLSAMLRYRLGRFWFQER